MITNIGLFIAVAAVATVICFFFVLGSVVVGILRTVFNTLSGAIGRGHHAAGESRGWSARSRRICGRPGCGRANVREAKYCAQCGQRLDG